MTSPYREYLESRDKMKLPMDAKVSTSNVSEPGHASTNKNKNKNKKRKNYPTKARAPATKSVNQKEGLASHQGASGLFTSVNDSNSNDSNFNDSNFNNNNFTNDNAVDAATGNLEITLSFDSLSFDSLSFDSGDDNEKTKGVGKHDDEDDEWEVV